MSIYFHFNFFRKYFEHEKKNNDNIQFLNLFFDIFLNQSIQGHEFEMRVCIWRIYFNTILKVMSNFPLINKTPDPKTASLFFLYISFTPGTGIVTVLFEWYIMSSRSRCNSSLTINKWLDSLIIGSIDTFIHHH